MKIRAPNCGVNSCRQEGLWKPCILMKRHDGKFAQADLDIRICSYHKDKIRVSDFMLFGIWKVIEDGFRANNIKLPNRDEAVLKWERWNPEIIVLET